MRSASSIAEISSRRRPEQAGAAAPTDADLLGRLAQGDSWAKEALYRRYFPSVWSTVLRLIRNRLDAEDIVQDVFIIAFDEFGSLRFPEALRPWLLQIAVHQVHRKFRRRKLLRILGMDREADDATLESLASPSSSPEQRAELGKLDDALARLPDKQRIAWGLRFVEGYALDEVAIACDCSLATVKRRIKEADVVIRARVNIEGGDYE
jgi:RNA polymerase sigma-70 factor (ECF subfamily)